MRLIATPVPAAEISSRVRFTTDGRIRGRQRAAVTFNGKGRVDMNWGFAAMTAAPDKCGDDIRTKNRAIALSAILLAAATGISADPAQAQTQTPTWSITGAGCVPTGQTAAGPGTFNSAGDAGFPAGRLGEIIVTCPVPSSIAGATSMAITYRDTDGRANGVRLRATLRQKVLATGAVSDVAGATFDSNGFPGGSANARRFAVIGSPCSGIRFDHDRFTYYIQVNMNRISSPQTVLLVSTELRNDLIC
jgi:hypothetical protein